LGVGVEKFIAFRRLANMWPIEKSRTYEFEMRLASTLIVMLISLLAGPLFSAPAPQAAPETVRVGGDIKPPLKVKNVAPVYPQIAITSHTQGVVILEATIGTDGKVKDTKVIRSIKQLDDAAITAVRAWEYKPTLVSGKAVQVIMTIPVNFTLN
jgi:TonB family protein